MGKSELAALVLGSPITRILWAPTDARPGMIRILAYHRVLDDAPATFPFDEALISATRETFRAQMEFVRRNFDVMTFADLYQCEQAGRRWPTRSVIVTFDDGYRDNYTHVFPILKELNLPATIFLATSYMGSCTRLFWWDKVAYCLKHTRHRELNLPQVYAQTMDISTPREQRKAYQRILRWVKRVPEEEKNAFLERLGPALDVPLPKNLPQNMHLSWEEVKEMAAAGIEFGGHSVTHPILANVSAEQLKMEVTESKQTIEHHLGKEAVVISYPEGLKPNYNEAVKQAAAQAGFRYGLSYEEGPACEDVGDHFAIPRIHVELEQSMSLFRANLMFPGVMGFRKSRS